MALLPAVLGDRVLFPRDARTAIPWRYNADAALRKELAGERVNDVLTDKNVFDFPKLHLAYRLWKEEAKAPLWNPYTFCGNPLVATAMPSPLYPGNWFFVLDPYHGFTWAALIHLLLSGFFVFLYIRSLGFRSTAGLLAGTTYAFSGWYLVHLYLPSYLYAATWFPLMLLSVERLLARGGVVWIAGLAGAVGLSALAGFPQVTVLSLYVTVLYTLFRLFRTWRHTGWMPALGRSTLAGVAVVLGLGLAAYQLWPTYEFKDQSGRSHLDITDVRSGALRPLGLIGLVLPDFFGNPVDQGPDEVTGRQAGELLPRKLGLDGPPPPEDWGNNYLENTLYLGVMPLLLALIALIRRPRPVTYFWLVIAAFAVLMAVALPPLQPVYEHAPFLRIGSIKRFLFVFTFAGAILAGIGFDGAIGAGPPRHRWGFFPYLPAIVLLATAGPLLLIPGLLDNLLNKLTKFTTLSTLDIKPGEMAAWVANTRWCILRMGAVLLPASAIYFLLRRSVVRPRPLRFLVLLITFLDLAWLGWAFNPVHRPDQLVSTPGIDFLEQKNREGPYRVARYGSEATFVLPPDTGMIYGIQDIQGWDVLFPARYQRFMNLIESDVGQAHHLIGPFRDHRSLSSPLVDLLGVRFVLTHDNWGPNPAQGFVPAYPLDEHGAFLKERIQREGLVIYENTERLPRAFVVAEAVHAANPDEVFQRLAGPGFEPERTVFLEGEPPAGEPLDPDRTVEVTGYRSRHVTVAVGPGGPAMLVLTDAFHPGWKARLVNADADPGHDVPIQRADAVFRAVALPASDHPVTVHFHYPGARFRHGLYVAAASAFLLLAVLIAGGIFRTRKRRLRES